MWIRNGFFLWTFFTIWDRRDYIEEKKVEIMNILLSLFMFTEVFVINYFLVNQTSKEIRFFQYPWSEFEWGLHTHSFFLIIIFVFIFIIKNSNKILYFISYYTETVFSSVILLYFMQWYQMTMHMCSCPALFISINNINTPNETTNVESLCFLL